MEIRTYDIKKKFDEFKDLSEQQLMCIAELCMDYYKLGEIGMCEENDQQQVIDDLENEVECLSSDKIDLESEIDKLQDLIEDCYKSKDLMEVKEKVDNFASTHKYGYYFDWEWLYDLEKICGTEGKN